MTACRTLSGLAVIALSGVFPSASEAAFYSGTELFKVCTTERSRADYIEKTYECVAYITGAVDAFNTTRETNKRRSCIPADVTIDRLKTVTVDYLRDNLDKRDAAASALVFAATRAAWPCGKRK
ncbi:MAG: hypothetical protein DI547_15700 [Sphingobium sp.]|nr:MAG: hypothetical protein DI547_15700 [Sphingobium sp.]